MTRKELVDLMLSQNDLNINEKMDFAENFILSQHPYTEEQKKDIKRRFSYVKSEIKCRWTKAKGTNAFMKKNEQWLEGLFELPKINKSKPGRPTKSFEESSERCKRRKTEALRLSDSPDKILYAAQMELRARGSRCGSEILKDITENQNRAHEYKKGVENLTQDRKSLICSEKALTMFVEANLTKTQYEIIRETVGNLPCYSILQQQKKKCYPPKEAFHVTETSAEVDIQALVNHTAQRLLESLQEVLCLLTDEERNSLNMICKWGCDGSQQAQFKQKFENNSACDSHVFQSSFVPLRITYGSNNKVLWQNPTPSSPAYCRPIRIRFIKETIDVTNEEISYVENAAKSLVPTQVLFGEISCNMQCTMLLTMVDGKVCNAATGTRSTLRCYICGQTSKDFNKMKNVENVDPENLKFGLSTLHARIRLFESLIHIAYKLPVDDLTVKSEENKKFIENTKKKIQNDFQSKLGLRVDFPKAGFGNSNDGNTSRRFFEDPELAAEITGLDASFINRIKIILECITSGFKIDVKKFSEYTKETAEKYVQLYGRHPMTPTMHKIFMHAPLVIEHALLPIGLLSEEAAEARNKHFRLYRQNFARKFSRVSCNVDVMNRLLLTSDPYISGKRKLTKNKKSFSSEALSLLVTEEDK